MNPLTNVRNQQKINERELNLGVAGTKSSWHQQYKDSAWVFVGGLPYDLTEGDIICVFSQYGEVVNINLVRDKSAGKSKGFCFLCYEDQRSTILAVDNLNGFKLLGRTLRVDHVANYRPPKETGEEDDVTQMLHQTGCAPQPVPPASSHNDEVKEKAREQHRVTKESDFAKAERDAVGTGKDRGRHSTSLAYIEESGRGRRDTGSAQSRQRSRSPLAVSYKHGSEQVNRDNGLQYRASELADKLTSDRDRSYKFVDSNSRTHTASRSHDSRDSKRAEDGGRTRYNHSKLLVDNKYDRDLYGGDSKHSSDRSNEQHRDTFSKSRSMKTSDDKFRERTDRYSSSNDHNHERRR